MHLSFRREFARASGFTLIELMVGLAVSLIVVMAMVVVFRNTVTGSIQSVSSASTAGQTAFAELSALAELQAAGYGIGIASNADVANHLVVLSGASIDASSKKLTGATQKALPSTPINIGATASDKWNPALCAAGGTQPACGNTVLWTFNDITSATPTPICRGLHVDGSSKQLILISSPSGVACSLSTPANNWGNIVWTQQTLATQLNLSSVAFMVAQPTSKCTLPGASTLPPKTPWVVSFWLDMGTTADRSMTACLGNMAT
ncbi:prepilin-type N-terminal cleavage/methylation domain-containing protein [Burkholderiaceae bacterium DAT-1]|nr:prepilin-type N-terminal cleavage/methylation domain-containing protein [Burkholderiaceae bacterium DAT-1]